MKFLPWGWGFAIALVGAIAFTPTQTATSHSIKVSQQPLPTQPYTTDFFSIDLPAGWMTYGSESDYYMFWSKQPPETGGGQIAPVDLIKTDIYLIDQDFETALDRNYFIGYEEENIISYREVQINGQDAVQFHTQGGGWDFPDTFVTIVRYSDEQSISMASYFTNSYASSLPTIEQLHQSLTITP